jgi:hypothetical protein
MLEQAREGSEVEIERPRHLRNGAAKNTHPLLVPAKAGIQSQDGAPCMHAWIPAPAERRNRPLTVGRPARCVLQHGLPCERPANSPRTMELNSVRFADIRAAFASELAISKTMISDGDDGTRRLAAQAKQRTT